MSRVEEALRRAADSAAPLDTRSTAPIGLEPRAHAFEVSALERYALEAPSRPEERLQPQPELQPKPKPKPVRVPPVPRADGRARAFAVRPALEGKLVVSQDIMPATVEQYRRLAAVLHDLQAQGGLKTVMVSSAAPGEGKTLTIANLALTLSESYHQRVLLIDADLRHPSLHHLFGIPNEVGLTDGVRAGGKPVPPVEISPGLSVLTAGRPVSSPLAMLTSDHVRTVVADAATRFDWVLLDTPPVGLLPDAQLVARLSDGVLFVIAAGVTPYFLVQRCLAELGADRIVGTILNRVEQERGDTHDYYEGYFGQKAGR
jgi:capsular exopolysaccharide synthesis family protein